MKEGKKLNKYIDFARELKKLRNMRMMVIPIIFGAFETVPKSLKKRLRGLDIRRRINTI